MAAASVPHVQSTLSPPLSSHGGTDKWEISVPIQSENSQAPNIEIHSKKFTPDPQSAKLDVSRRANTNTLNPHSENELLSSPRLSVLNTKDGNISDTGSATDSLLDLYGLNRGGISSMESGDGLSSNSSKIKPNEDSEKSRWIHRDKLARIESQELQAAGILLPHSRAPSKASSRRQHSRDIPTTNTKAEQTSKRQQIDSLPTEEEEAPESNTWDLRLPEEILGSSYVDAGGSVKSLSRIPVCKKSPFPIPTVHLERDTPLQRKKSSTLLDEEDTVSYSKVRGSNENKKESSTTASIQSKRAVSENLPPKKPGVRNRSASANKLPTQRPRTRSGSIGPQSLLRGAESAQATTKRPEGDPPWLSSMYKPDPRLPPDQQILPTIAKRLQQEKWEKEGKFGNVYDTSFRPLNDQAPLKPSASSPTRTNESGSEHGTEWPLRNPKSPSLSTGRPGTAGGYSTMPKIIELPPAPSPLPSARAPIKLQEPEPELNKRKACGCCTIM
ncbi:BgTH12-03753 [Blumeria graminis f. sp. triticale]|uniref:Bgt-2163 n=3 Tax=Blumeria graminis TaxID=34373 RepID=A0A061HLK6_BLUGR|nr:hypothetical protein BGT96224_2163 [Blumeria graminis f. sp. tritici 96224]CAD6499643.1 BgTH12-03753 [Blumeria graminis f. sp. triticale]VCU39808.1 Bgt-2163 [Blumeria graminis f. sp. tritici]